MRLMPSLLQALSKCMFFFDTQREGYLPVSSPVPWRGNSFTGDYDSTVVLASSLPTMSTDTDVTSGQVGWHCCCLPAV